MTWIMTKYLITAGLVVLISEIAKRSDKIGALIAALPFVTILTLFWLYFENQPSEKIATHAYYTFWYVIPTLPMFLIFPWLIEKLGFWGAIGSSLFLMILCFAVFSYLVRTIGIDLLN